MYKVFLPFVKTKDNGLHGLFREHGISYGMAAEYTSFESAVQKPIILKHAGILTTEVSMKMEYTQPAEGVYEYEYADALIARAQENRKLVHGHCILWHLQYPGWLDGALSKASQAGRVQLLREHVRHLVEHYAGGGSSLVSLDVVNELEPAVAVGASGFSRYLGLEAGEIALGTAREYASSWCKLFYNSFFREMGDVYYAISLLEACDGIGIQMHLDARTDNREFFSRVRFLIESCAKAGKLVRFSEVSVVGTPEEAAVVWGQIVRLALDTAPTVCNVTQWGVKGQAWNGGRLPFDNAGQPAGPIYEAMMGELRR